MKDEQGNIKAKSPFTGHDDVIIETAEGAGESRMCMVSGYNTRELYKFNNPDIEKFEETTTELIKSLKYKDEELGQYWYLTTVVTGKGMIYPDSDGQDSYEWVFAPIVKINKEEQEEYPIPAKPGEFYESRLAIEASERFNKESFLSACRRLGAVK